MYKLILICTFVVAAYAAPGTSRGYSIEDGDDGVLPLQNFNIAATKVAFLSRTSPSQFTIAEIEPDVIPNEELKKFFRFRPLPPAPTTEEPKPESEPPKSTEAPSAPIEAPAERTAASARVATLPSIHPYDLSIQTLGYPAVSTQFSTIVHDTKKSAIPIVKSAPVEVPVAIETIPASIQKNELILPFERYLSPYQAALSPEIEGSQFQVIPSPYVHGAPIAYSSISQFALPFYSNRVGEPVVQFI